MGMACVSVVSFEAGSYLHRGLLVDDGRGWRQFARHLPPQHDQAVYASLPPAAQRRALLPAFDTVHGHPGLERRRGQGWAATDCAFVTLAAAPRRRSVAWKCSINSQKYGTPKLNPACPMCFPMCFRRTAIWPLYGNPVSGRARARRGRAEGQAMEFYKV